MSADPAAPIPQFLTKGMSLAVAAVTAAALVNVILASISGARLALIALLSAAYALLGTAGVLRLERHGKRSHLIPHFATMLAVALAAVAASRGAAVFMLMSLISECAVYLGLPAAAGVAVVFVASRVFVFGAYGSELDRMRSLVSWSAASAFVVSFSSMMVRLARANARLREYAEDARVFSATLERNRIAREIHDGLGHYLTVVHVQLEAAQATLRTQPEQAERALEKAKSLTRDGLGEVRKAVAVLRGPLLPASLVESLEKLVEEHRAGGARAELVLEGTARKLTEPVEFALYRAAQEALTNARKHGRAKHVQIALIYGAAREMRLRVEDDGAGAEQPKDGFGLLGLRERAALLGGKVDVRTAPGRGFTLEIVLPG